MRVVALLLVLVAGAIAQIAQTNLTSQNALGFDIIVLDSPSWVTSIERSWGTNEFFVFGETTLRTIIAGENATGFYAEPVGANWDYPLIDLAVFFNLNKTVRYTFGITGYTPDAADRFDGSAIGTYMPMFDSVWHLDTPEGSQSIQPANIGPADFSGVMSYALKVDYRNSTPFDIVTYFAGFRRDVNGTLNFGLIKTSYNPLSNPMDPLNQNFLYDPFSDVFTFYTNCFTAFSNVFKPWIHYIPDFAGTNHTLVIVVDPNTRTVYAVDTDVANNPVISSYPLVKGFTGMQIVSTTMAGPGQLVVGMANSGLLPGSIQIFNFGNSFTVPTPTQLNLPLNYSNPKALTADSDFIYIGFNGWAEVMRMAINGSIVGYQRLPEFLHRSWDATLTHEHVYFVSYEQNAKVYRVAKTDFCSTVCPYNGYCSKGKCLCGPGYEMAQHNQQCVLTAAADVVIYKHIYHVAHSGEVALGVLFALTFVAGGAGWALWYRNRRGSYQSV